MQRKSIEDTVTSLRQELQVLYESLKNKNEQLLCFEKDIRDRDNTVKMLKEECKKLKDGLTSFTCKTCPNCMKLVKNTSDEIPSSDLPQNDTELSKLQKNLKDRENLIKELNRKVIRLSDNLIFVQKESLSKDDLMEEMNRKLDKFREVVKLITNLIFLNALV